MVRDVQMDDGYGEILADEDLEEAKAQLNADHEYFSISFKKYSPLTWVNYSRSPGTDSGGRRRISAPQSDRGCTRVVPSGCRRRTRKCNTLK